MELIQKRLTGHLVYIPIGKSEKIQQRNRILLSKFNGKNHQALAIEFGLSIRRIYEITQKPSKPKHKKPRFNA